MSASVADAKAELALGWRRLTHAWAERCHTARGAALAAAPPLLATAEEARARIELVSEARALRAADRAAPFGGIHDLAPLLAALAAGEAADGEVLWQVCETLGGIARLRRALLAARELAPGLAAHAEEIRDLTFLQNQLETALEPGGRLADAASPALGPLRRRVIQLGEETGRRAKAMLDDPELEPHLQDRFYTRRDERFVVPVRVASKNLVRGIVHGLSGSGQTVFVEPAVMVEVTNQLRLAELEVKAEELRILRELSAEVQRASPVLEDLLARATTLDLIDGAARLAADLGAVAIAPAGEAIDLRRARHPLLVLDGKVCVAVDVVAARGAALVVSGPNAGGKTVALKTTGLCALMVRAGLHLPCEERSRLPFFDAVRTDVGDDQSLESDLSTFSAHVVHLGELLHVARVAALPLLLIDEIAAGTDPVQGAAIAQAVLEALVEAGATVLVTTHYDRLKALAERDPRFENASVGFDLERMAPTFELHHGVPGSSGALAVARRFGLPGPVVARAEGLLGSGERGIERLLGELADARRKVGEEIAAAAEARREAERLADKLAAEKRELDVQFKKARRLAYDEVVAELRGARAEIDHARKKLRQGQTSTIAEVERAIDHAAGKARAAAPPRDLEGAHESPPPAESLVPGASVRIVSTGATGRVLASPERGRVLVQLGSARMQVKLPELRLDKRGPGAARGPGAVTVTRSVETAPLVVTPRHPGNTLDLRGERVDDALARVDEFLDGALRQGWDAAYVLHGHGTNALKNAVRAHLAGHPAARQALPGERGDGGDGVTVVLLP